MDRSGIAIGESSIATGRDGLAIGSGARSGGTSGNGFTNSGTTAIGQGAQAGTAANNQINATAIGQNAIANGRNATVLGQNASALGEDSIVFGQDAKDNGVRNSVVLGKGAYVATGLQGDNVALGRESAAQRGQLSNYSAFGLSGTQNSLGEVAVGTSSALRQITGVAAASQGTDAVNLNQLKGVAGIQATALTAGLGGGASYNSTTGVFTAPSYTVQSNTFASVGGALNQLDVSLTSLQSSFASSASGILLQDSGTNNITLGAATAGTLVNLTGTAGNRRVTGLAAGTATNDAVNFGQLTGVANAQATALTAGLGGGASYNSTTGVFTAPSYTVQSNTFASVGGALNQLDVSLTSLQSSFASSGAGILLQDSGTNNITLGAATAGTLVNLTGTAGNRRVTGLAAGTATNDAVNFGQLTGVANTQATALTAGLGGGASYNSTTGVFTAPSYTVQSNTFASVGGALNQLDVSLTSLQNSFTSSAAGILLQDSGTNNITLGALTAGTLVDLTGTAGNRRVTGLAAGTATNDAVNFGQLTGVANAQASALTSGLGGGASYNSTTGVFTAPSYTVQSNTFASVGGALNQLDVSLTSLQNSFASSAAGILLQDSGTNNITLGALTAGTLVDLTGTAGNRRVTGLAAGTATNDAVNFGQLTGVANAQASALTSGLGGGASYNSTTGVFTAPSYTVQSNTFASVGGALNQLDVSLTSLQNSFTSSAAGILLQNSGTNNITLGALTAGTLVDLTGTAGNRRLTGLAAGTAANDAVTLAQLNAAVASVSGGGGGGSAAAAQAAADAAQSTADTALSNSKYYQTNSTGADPQANGNDTVAAGPGAQADGDRSVAIGVDARTIQGQAVSIGAANVASGDGAVAIGDPNIATGVGAVAVGANNTATGQGAVAIGNANVATGASAIALGDQARAQAAGSIAIGSGAVASRVNQVALGSSSSTYTMAGIDSDASRAAQSGAVRMVTSDAAGNLATAPVDIAELQSVVGRTATLEGKVQNMSRALRQAEGGIAAAMALGGTVMPPDSKLAVSFNLATYRGQQGFSAAAVAKITDRVWVSGGVAGATTRGSRGGRVGVTFSL